MLIIRIRFPNGRGGGPRPHARELAQGLVSMSISSERIVAAPVAITNSLRSPHTEKLAFLPNP
jgi:hypothetical protein